MSTAPAGQYTKPELREKLKEKIKAGDKGGKPGQWSARKSQLLVHDYEAEGGGYKSGKRTDSQKSLKKWGEEKWTTADGKKAQQGETMHRYLPEKAWDKLSPAEKQQTDRKKVAASKKGKQFAANTEKAKKARKSVTGAKKKED